MEYGPFLCLKSCKHTFNALLSRIWKFTRFMRFIWKVFTTEILLSGKFLLFLTLCVTCSIWLNIKDVCNICKSVLFSAISIQCIFNNQLMRPIYLNTQDLVGFVSPRSLRMLIQGGRTLAVWCLGLAVAEFKRKKNQCMQRYNFEYDRMSQNLMFFCVWDNK